MSDGEIILRLLGLSETSREFKIKRKRRTHKCDLCRSHRDENVERTPRRSWKFRGNKRRQHG